MVNDPIADFLSRIRNALTRKKDEVTIPANRMVISIVEILKSEGFVESYEIVESEIGKNIVVTLKYEGGRSVISDLKRVSKPGIRKYRGYRDIKKVKNGLGISIYSTPKGIITGDDAVKSKLGGEYICDIS